MTVVAPVVIDLSFSSLPSAHLFACPVAMSTATLAPDTTPSAIANLPLGLLFCLVDRLVSLSAICLYVF